MPELAPVDTIDLNLEDQLVPPAAEQTPPADAGASQSAGAAQPEVTPPSGLAANWMQRAQAAGLPLDGINDTEGLLNVVLDRYVQERPYSDYGRQALTHPQSQPTSGDDEDEEIEEEFNEESYFQKAWSVPKLSPGAQFALDNGAFTENDRGMIIPAAGLENHAIPYLQEISNYQASMKAQNESFRQNPVAFMAKALAPWLDNRYSGQLQTISNEIVQEHQHTAFEDRFKAEHKGWLFTPDGKALSPEGTKFKEAVAELREQGIKDPQRLANYAMKLAGINPQAAPITEVPVQSATEGKLAGRARDEQGRLLPAGTPAPPPAPVTKQQSFIDKARQQAAQTGSQQGYAEAGEFNVANDGELENMFTQGWKRHVAAA